MVGGVLLMIHGEANAPLRSVRIRMVYANRPADQCDQSVGVKGGRAGGSALTEIFSGGIPQTAVEFF